MADSVPMQYRLKEWLGVFHPAYRRYLAGLLGIGFVSGVLTYLNLELLQGLVKTFSALGGLEQIGCAEASEIHFLTGIIVCNGIATGWAVAFLVLVTYATMELLQAALSIFRQFVQGRLEIKSRNDIEREILINLIRKDDQFFQRQSATQIANRLSEDTSRMFERREDVSQLWSVSVQAIGALAFLWSQNWSYAAAVLVFSLAGVYIIHRMLQQMRELDGAQLQADDNVKAAFEDYLHAVPEAQMGNLTGKITKSLGAIQVERQSAFMGLVWLSSKLSATYALTQLVAFGAIMVAIIYVVTVHGFRLEDGLVAAVVRAVPQLYGNISEIAKLFMKFQLADVSARRLLEYETERELATAESADRATIDQPSPIVFDRVRYTFTPDGQPQGGPKGISLKIAPASLNVIVGPSGSGKSMLSQLLMGRLKSISGQVLYGERNIGELGMEQRSQIFSYMPQSLAMIAGSIEDNVLFGRTNKDTDNDGGIDDSALDWIDRTGVGRFAREKSLDMSTGAVELPEHQSDLGSLRQQLRERVSSKVGIDLISFADNPLVPHLSILEHLSHSAAHPEKMLPLAFSRGGFRAMDHLATLEGADNVIAFGQHIITQTSHMLVRCPTYEAYSELAPFRISPPVWDMRSRLSGESSLDEAAIRAELILVALTATPREAEAAVASEFAATLDGPDLGKFKDAVNKHFAPSLEPISQNNINPALSWRDNLLFGTPKTVNTPTARAVDQMLLEEAADTELDPLLLQSGLRYELGRQGKRLSGGQRQLICLCRTFLQGCPVLVLDEPTAALDPRRRGEMNALLRSATDQHTIIAITHDAELARLADQVIMVKEGHLFACGTFDQLAKDHAEFRSLTNAREEVPS